MIEITKTKVLTKIPSAMCNGCTEEISEYYDIKIVSSEYSNGIMSLRLCSKCLQELKDKIINLDKKEG